MINRAVAHYRESFHHRDQTFDFFCHLANYQDQAHGARLFQINTNVGNHKHGKCLTHLGSNKIISRQNRTANHEQTPNKNLMDKEEIAEGEDMLTIDDHMQKAEETRSYARSIHYTE